MHITSGSTHSGACTIRHPLGNEEQHWIIEVSLHGKNNGQCQTLLAGLGECQFVEVLD
jgi:hypothetical protein